MTGCYVAPEESTLRRSLKAIDANALDRVVNAWTRLDRGPGRRRQPQRGSGEAGPARTVVQREAGAADDTSVS